MHTVMKRSTKVCQPQMQLNKQNRMKYPACHMRKKPQPQYFFCSIIR